MKTLTLTEPWATLVAIGAKCIETRSWQTGYRGPLAIHAAKGYARGTTLLCREEPFASALAEAGITRLSPGAIIAVVVLVGCWRIPATYTQIGPCFALPAPEPERSFGDYTPGRYAWRLENARRLKEPLPWKGALGLWNGPEILPEMLEEAKEKC